jgi:nucleotide-binding universal stress UspA family protein
MNGLLLLCFDGSAEAAHAIRTVGTLMPGRDALVLTVAPSARHELPLDPIGDLAGRLSRLYHDWDEAAAEIAAAQAQSGCEIARDAGMRAEALVASGKPTPTILRVAEEHDAAAIVLGAGHHGAVGVLGSVSLGVTHRARRPVLVIPKQ